METSASSSSKATIQSKVPNGKKRTFAESLTEVAREREEGRMKRSADTLTFLKEKHEGKTSVLLEREKTAQEHEKTVQEQARTAQEKAKAEKFAQKTAFIKQMLAAGFSKEEIGEHLKEV